MDSIFAGSFDKVDFGVWGIVFGIGAILFMLIFWVLPFILGFLGIKKAFESYKIKNPNSWLTLNWKKLIIIGIALIPIIFIGFNLYVKIDFERYKKRVANYPQCLKENNINLRKGDSDQVCAKYLKKDWIPF